MAHLVANPATRRHAPLCADIAIYPPVPLRDQALHLRV